MTFNRHYRENSETRLFGWRSCRISRSWISEFPLDADAFALGIFGCDETVDHCVGGALVVPALVREILGAYFDRHNRRKPPSAVRPNRDIRCVHVRAVAR